MSNSFTSPALARPSVALAGLFLAICGACASPHNSAQARAQNAQPMAAPTDNQSSKTPTTSPADEDKSIFDRPSGQRMRILVTPRPDTDAAVRAMTMAQMEQQVRNAVKDSGGQNFYSAFNWDTGKTEKAAYLGVTTSAVDPALRNQLSLQRGVGLTVDYVEADGPAAKAGLQHYDILERLDDQILVNSEQLGVLIRLHKEGDTVTLTLIRQSKSTTIPVTLSQHDVPVEASTDSLMPRDFKVKLDNMTADLARGTMVLTPAEVGSRSSAKGNEVSLVDGSNVLTITQKDGQDYLVATDLKGKVLFKGPVQTRAQRLALPKDLAAKIDRLRSQVMRAPIPESQAIEFDSAPAQAPATPAPPAPPSAPAPPAPPAGSGDN